MEKIRIEKGIKMPESHGRGKGWSDLIRSMKVGDSFYIADKSKRASIAACGFHLGRRIATRNEGEGIRCWYVGDRGGGK